MLCSWAWEASPVTISCTTDAGNQAAAVLRGRRHPAVSVHERWEREKGLPCPRGQSHLVQLASLTSTRLWPPGSYQTTPSGVSALVAREVCWSAERFEGGEDRCPGISTIT